MDEADARIELGIAGQALLDPRHSDQHQADLVPIEQVAQLLQTRDLQPIGFIDEDQPDGRQRWLPRSDGHVEKPCRRLALPHARKPIVFEEEFLASSLLLASQRLDGSLKGATLRRLLDAAQARTEMPDAICHGAWAVHDLRRVQDGIGAVEGGERFVIGLPDRGQSLETIPGRVMTSRQGFANPRRVHSTGRCSDSADRHRRTRRSGDIRW